MADSDLTLDEVLAQTVWLRRLAHHLVRDEAERDDVVQEAWIEALKKNTRPRAVRPWMFGLVRNVARMRLRGEGRRRRHEEEVPAAEAPATPDELVERVEVERRVVAACTAVGVRVIYLPPYSPDFNPIEPAWALQKQHVRKHAPRCPQMLRRIARRARFRVTSRHCRNWFAHSGYSGRFR